MKRAFTLIELMVCIAIIAILTTLVVTAVGKAKAKARQIACASRQKQWAYAFMQYAEDHDGFTPREGYDRLGRVTWDNWSQVKGRVSPPGNQTDSSDIWYNALPGIYLPGVLPASAYSHPTRRLDFYEEESFFHCPAAVFPEKTQSRSYGIALFSMAMNSQLIQFPNPVIKWSRIYEHGEPNRTPLFMDGLLEGEEKVHSLQANGFLGQPSVYANRFSARHYGGGNLAFADGHVEWYPGAEVVQTDSTKRVLGGPIVPPVDIIWEVP